MVEQRKSRFFSRLVFNHILITISSNVIGALAALFFTNTFLQL